MKNVRFLSNFSKSCRIRDKEFKFPDHVNSLRQEEIDRILETSETDKKVFACGVDPRDSSLIFLTCDGNAWILKPNGNLIPEMAFPVEDGRHIEIKFRDLDGVHPINSKNTIDVSVNAFSQNSGLFLNGTKILDI